MAKVVHLNRIDRPK